MRNRKGLLALTIGGILVLGMAYVPSASAAARVVVVRPFVGPVIGYRPFYGPGWYGPGRVYIAGPATGEVKIETKAKNDTVYVDGGYIGTTHDMKKFSLRPGNHDIEVRGAEGQPLFHQRVQVLIDKTVDIKLNG